MFVEMFQLIMSHMRDQNTKLSKEVEEYKEKLKKKVKKKINLERDGLDGMI